MESRTRVKRICIDISNLVPGQGGSGGGIATYAMNLVREINRLNENKGWEIFCIKHPGFKAVDDCGNINMVNIGTKKKNFLFEVYRTQLYLPFFCLRHKIDLLHKVTPELPLIKVCKYVCTLHDLMFDFYLANPGLKKFLKRSEKLKSNFFSRITQLAIGVSDAIIVPSHAIKNELTGRYGVAPAKITVTHEATEKNNHIPASHTGIAEKILQIGVIAGFHPHKGHRRVLNLAHKFIQAGFSDFRISFRGTSFFQHYYEEMLSTRDQLKLNDHVFFVPFDPGITLNDIYARFDIIMLLSEYEGFGLPVLEAQAHNIPVFCSDLPVFKEILGDSAYYIPGNEQLIPVQQIIDDLKDRAALNRYVSLGVINLQKFSWEKMARETMDLYRQTIKA